MKLRPASPDDDSALAELDARAWPRELWVSPPQPADEPFFSDHRQPADVLVATADDGTVIGYARLARHLRTDANAHVVHLDAVAVAPESTGQGAGRALIAAAIAEARQRGARKLGLRALSTNGRAIALYEAAGFVEEGRLVGEILLPDGSYADDVWFALFF